MTFLHNLALVLGYIAIASVGTTCVIIAAAFVIGESTKRADK